MDDQLLDQVGTEIMKKMSEQTRPTPPSILVLHPETLERYVAAAERRNPGKVKLVDGKYTVAGCRLLSSHDLAQDEVIVR